MTSEVVGRAKPSLKLRSQHGRSREDKGERRPDLVFVEHCTTNLVEQEGTTCRPRSLCDVQKTLLHTVEC